MKHDVTEREALEALEVIKREQPEIARAKKLLSESLGMYLLLKNGTIQLVRS